MISKLLPHSVLKDLASLTYHDIVKRNLVTPFLIFVSFLLSFGLTRLLAYTFPSLSFIVGKYHIHHFYYGIGFIIVSNWISLITNRETPRLISSVLFGFGLGIIADEIGLLLTCTSPLMLQCDYYTRITLDIFTIIVAIFLAVLYFVPAFRGFRHMVSSTHRMVYRRIRQ